MTVQPAKLVLPTIATCRWRSVNGASAECGLVARLTGVAAGGLSAVSDATCDACCSSFPPSPRRLNPIVASLVFSAASRIAAAGGTPDCSVERADRLKGLAERSMDLVVPDQFRVTPARAVGPCFYLGDVIRSARMAETNGGVQADLPALDDPGEVLSVCNHPAHERTTPAGCRMCRDWTKQRPLSRSLSLTELTPPPQRRCGPPVRKWAVGVTTAPRRRPTLELCLDAVVRAGWEQPRLFLDGLTPIPPRYGHLPVTWREEGIGAWPAWYLALSELVLQLPDADAYMMLQDDVAPYDRESLRGYLEQVLWPGERPGLISLFYTGHNLMPGWHDAAGEWHWGAQGFIFSPGLARALLDDGALWRACLAASGDHHLPIPELIGEWAHRAGVDVWYASPSLTQHIGNTSTIWMNAAIADGRRASWFSGNIEAAFAAEESLADFPEDLFPCHDAGGDEFLEQVERGRRRMRELSTVICGLCRDVRHFLPRMAARIERLGAMFRDYRVVLYENDSVDPTREFLLDWQAANPRVEVISEELGAPSYPQARSLDRAAWMAQCRNRYRTHVVSRYEEMDCAMVADMDLAGGWSFDGIAHTFGDEGWDFVGSYGLEHRLDPHPEGPYSHVDRWAFRPARDVPAIELALRTEPHGLRGQSLLPVESCFGGLGVYRMACFQAAEYGGADCEHVVFHDRLRRAGLGRQFLNPSQIVLYTPV
jgi:hypothetical protein